MKHAFVFQDVGRFRARDGHDRFKDGQRHEEDGEGDAHVEW